MDEEQKVSILVVNDRPEQLLAFQAILADLGQHLVAAQSGREALRCLLRQDFAVVLLDVNMPGLDGFETAALIRQRMQSEHTPIIFITAVDTSPTFVARGYSLGAVDYLFTPVVPEILRAKVAVFVELFKKTQEVERQARELRETIAAQRRLEQQLQRQNEELALQNRRAQEASRIKSEFLANMSHEVRTPLNSIIGFSELMHDGKVGPVSDEHRQYLGYILASARHLIELINDVLDLARVESGKLELRPEAVDPARLIGEVRAILATLAATRGIRVETEVDSTLGEVFVDPARLKQVLYNYLSNALKFTPEGGRVAIRVGPEDPEAFRLEVEDNGIGIRPEDVGRLFVEFQQLDAGTAKKYPGTGLGLALTRRLVEAQGGRVGVRSTPGQGSVFFAVLPRVDRAGRRAKLEAAPRPAAPPVAHRRDRASIVLVVEDDPHDRDVLAQVLAEAGYAVETVASGALAVARCREQAFDAITLDLLLPDMDGWHVLEALRLEGRNRYTPVVVVTVVGDSGIRAVLPIHDLLTKPVRPEALLAALERTGVAPHRRQAVLVVDDDPITLKLLEQALAREGYRPVCCPDGESALEAAQADVRAVVLDLLLPGMDGFEFLARFRRTAAGRHAPVVVWTVHELAEADRARLLASAQAVVPKGQGGTAALLEALRACLPPAPDEETEKRRSGLAGEPILVVDDNPVNLQLVSTLLEMEGCEVRIAADARGALATLRTFRPRLILLDLQLPDVDGLELARRLKAEAATRDITILALSAYAMKGDDEKALAAGCDGYITKPIDTRALPDILARQLARDERKRAVS